MSNIIKISDRVENSAPSATVMIADIAKKLKEQGETVIDFSAGRAFEPTPAYLIDMAELAMREGDTHQTMAKGKTIFRNAVTEKLKRENGIDSDPEKNIIATMGVKQGMTISLLALINPGDEVIVEDPCFVTYMQLISFLGGKAVPVPIRAENNFRWDKNELESAITSKTKGILFNSPHNPTGVVHTREDLEVIADLANKYNLFVIADEVYEELTWGGRKHLNICKLPGMKERTISLNSLTKSFSMGGWRIGYALADEPVINALEKLQQHLITSCNAFVQTAAALAFSEPTRDEVLAYWKEWEEKCLFVTSELDTIDGINCYMPEGAFYAWIDIKQLGLPSQVFVEKLLKEEKVALVHGSAFGDFGEGYVRMTCVKTYEDTNEGLERIERFINKLK